MTQGESAVTVTRQVAYAGDAGQQDTAVAHQAGFEADVQGQTSAVDLRMFAFELVEHLHLGVGGAAVSRGEHLVASAAQQFTCAIHQQCADRITTFFECQQGLFAAQPGPGVIVVSAGWRLLQQGEVLRVHVRLLSLQLITEYGLLRWG